MALLVSLPMGTYKVILYIDILIPLHGMDNYIPTTNIIISLFIPVGIDRELIGFTNIGGCQGHSHLPKIR